jgi:hypothetical protein
MTKIVFQKLIFVVSLLGCSFAFANQPCTDSSRECVVAAASEYLKALVSHEPSHVPFADNVKRWENAIDRGQNADEIRKQLTSSEVQTIAGLRDIHWVVDGNQAVAYYLLDVVYPGTHIRYGTTHIAERFVVVNGKIQEIEATFCASANSQAESSKIMKPTHLPFLCNRSLI